MKHLALYPGGGCQFPRPRVLYPTLDLEIAASESLAGERNMFLETGGNGPLLCSGRKLAKSGLLHHIYVINLDHLES